VRLGSTGIKASDEQQTRRYRPNRCPDSGGRNPCTTRCTVMWCSLWCMTIKRLSVTLEPDDESAVTTFQADGAERDALMTWAVQHGVDPRAVRSEAGVLRVLLRAGVETLREHALDRGYARMAAAASGVEEQAEGREARSRHLSRSANL